MYFLLFAFLSITAFASSDSPALKKEEMVQGGADGVGKNVQNFGEQVASRIDRVVKKKAFEFWGEPWTMQGIPLLFPGARDGLNLGLKVSVQNIARQDPHKLEFDAQVLASDGGRYKHHLKVDWPHAFGDRFRITSRVAYDRDISINYFGLGNDTPVNLDAITAENPLYQHVRSSPNFYIQMLALLGKDLRFGPVFGLRFMEISFPVGSLIDQERPLGVEGGRTNFIALALQRDTRDFEPYPSRGTLNELMFNYYGRVVGSDYEFTRTTYTFQYYSLLHRKLIFAHRTFFEVLNGNAPFYELGFTGGLNPSLVLGGDRFLRGFQGNRFTDRIRLIAGFELRWDPFFFLFAKQDITIGFVSFFDFGRVWSTLFPIPLKGFHASAGYGIRIIWNSRLILRGDMAFNEEGVSFLINLGSAF